MTFRIRPPRKAKANASHRDRSPLPAEEKSAGGTGPGVAETSSAWVEPSVPVSTRRPSNVPLALGPGGGVTIRCANLLPFSIEPVIEDVVTRARLRFRERAEVVRDAPAPLTYMTQRRRLDAFLVERAQEAGVEFRDGQAVRITAPDGTVLGEYAIPTPGSGAAPW